MSKKLTTCLLIASAWLFVEASSVQAGVYNINLRAYRRTMRLNYPGPHSGRFGRFLDEQVLNDGGLFDRLLDRLERETASTATTAITPASVDTNLLRSVERMENAYRVYDPDYQPTAQPTTNTPPGGSSNGTITDVPTSLPSDVN